MEGETTTPALRGEGLVGRAWAACVPVVEHGGEAGAGAAVAIPFLKDARVTAVVVWRF